MKSENSKMPAETRRLWDCLAGELSWIHLKWENFRALFVEADTVALLNDVAGTFFGICQRTFLDDTILGISRLTDEHKNSKGAKVSLKRLVGSIDDQKELTLLKEAKESLERIDALSKPFRTNRNLRIAHNDYHTLMETDGELLPGISRAKIGEVLDEIHRLLNSFSIHYDRVTWSKFVVGPVDDARSLILFLRRAREIQNEDPEGWWIPELRNNVGGEE